MTEEIGRECKFAIHIPANQKRPDTHLIKETIHYADGTTKPHVKFVKDFKRPFYVTRPSFRNHRQKKEYEHVDNLLEVFTTQSNLRDEVAKLLGKSFTNDHIKKLSTSPFLYGSDISSTSLIKKAYQNKYPNCTSRYTVATLDIETDVIGGTETVIITTVAYQNQCYTAVLKDFLAGYVSIAQSKIKEAEERYIGEYLKDKNIVSETYIANDPVDLLKHVFSKIHEWQPDILAIWNMNFDIPRIMKVLEQYKVDPPGIFCDPCVPKDFRICRYKEGQTKKIMASGKVIPINFEAQWHTLICTSSYYILDAMCTYKFNRLSEPSEPSYALDALLAKHKVLRKLKFEEASQYTDLKWHEVMQADYKIEYIVYNKVDCLSMLDLDEETKDLAYTLPNSADTTDFSKYKSMPSKIMDAFYHFLKTKGFILGTVGYADKDEEDDTEIEDDTLGLNGWIVCLDSMLQVPGMNCIAEDPLLHTGIRCYVYDSDRKLGRS